MARNLVEGVGEGYFCPKCRNGVRVWRQHCQVCGFWLSKKYTQKDILYIRNYLEDMLECYAGQPPSARFYNMTPKAQVKQLLDWIDGI